MIFQRPVVGLDISDHSIEMVEVRLARSKWQVKHWNRLILDRGIVEGGKLQQPGAIVEALQAMQKKGEFSKKPKVLLSFPDNQVFTTTISLPADLEKKELEATILFKAREALPIELNNANLDWFKTYESEEFTEYVVSATPQEEVDAYQSMLQNSRLTPWIFDIQPLCIARALGKEEGSEPCLVVDIGDSQTLISIFDHQGMRTNVYLQSGSSQLTGILSEKMHITREQAETLKIQHGLGTFPARGKKPVQMPDVQEEEEETTKKKKPAKRKKAIKKRAPKKTTPRKQSKKTSSTSEKIQKILQIASADLVTELTGTIEYYRNRYDLPLKKILIVGGGSSLKGLDGFITQATALPTSLGKVRPDVVKLPPDQHFYMNAIGAGIRGLSNHPQEEGINLLDPHR